jgi:hypothetical protein
MNCELMLTYDTPTLRQTGSRNLTGPKTLPTNMVYLYDACDQISDLCHQQLLRKMRRKISWTDRRTEVKQYTPLPLRGVGV